MPAKHTSHTIATLIIIAALSISSTATADAKIKFKRIPSQFIAALGDPGASAGSGAETWGLWNKDPGPRGVWLSLFPVLKAAGGYAPGNWKFDETDWWLDENGLIMEKPVFPVPAGRYLVTGEREVTTMLTVHPKDQDGAQRWELDSEELFDVTHMPCRSARYTPANTDTPCTPANADKTKFKVAPGSLMPAVPGCNKQDYSVLIVIGIADT